MKQPDFRETVKVLWKSGCLSAREARFFFLIESTGFFML